jgi:hypothetical protein
MRCETKKEKTMKTVGQIIESIKKMNITDLVAFTNKLTAMGVKQHGSSFEYSASVALEKGRPHWAKILIATRDRHSEV